MPELSSQITSDGNYYKTIRPNARYKFLTVGATGSTIIRGQFVYNNITGDYSNLHFTGKADADEFLSKSDVFNVYASGVLASPINVLIEPVRLK